MNVVSEKINIYYNDFLKKIEEEFKNKYIIFDRLTTQSIIKLNGSSLDIKQRQKDKVFKVVSIFKIVENNNIVDYNVIVNLESGNFKYRLPLNVILEQGILFNDRETAQLAFECYE